MNLSRMERDPLAISTKKLDAIEPYVVGRPTGMKDKANELSSMIGDLLVLTEPRER